MSSQEEEHLATLLVIDGICSTSHEASVMAEVIMSDLTEFDSVEMALQEYLDLSEDQTKELASRLKQALVDPDFEEDEEDEPTSGPSVDENEEDGMMLFDGECELCDRYIQLTKHHLIPKSTWPRLQVRLLHAAEANEKGDMERALSLLGPGLEHLLHTLTTDKTSIRGILRQTCDICRPCHTAVHKAHANMDLALLYSSVDKLLEHEQISRFCKWANKQRPGRYAVK
jgi:hypothetical protein